MDFCTELRRHRRTVAESALTVADELEAGRRSAVGSYFRLISKT
jgi:hypothetical protein